MGADIYVYTEIRTSEGGEDQTGDLDLNRDYDLFARLTDYQIRRPGSAPIAPARGVPADASPNVREGLADLHSHSWFTLTELEAHDWRAFPDFPMPFLRALASRVGGPDNVRIIFGIDN